MALEGKMTCDVNIPMFQFGVELINESEMLKLCDLIMKVPAGKGKK